MVTQSYTNRKDQMSTETIQTTSEALWPDHISIENGNILRINQIIGIELLPLVA